jgi:hypothetical protein
MKKHSPYLRSGTAFSASVKALLPDAGTAGKDLDFWSWSRGEQLGQGLFSLSRTGRWEVGEQGELFGAHCDKGFGAENWQPQVKWWVRA